ncbi:response regulator [Planktothrix sp. FACHB-1355]|uniref:Adenylate cyclase n=1 Tax=Aerosakkonema funiforme FACHB-1375 TaxID=2949571 RepID=A0A926ZFJ8_9CYAN|nr:MULTISPECIES: adenylate/guanylate cyclase domain-containing protein [Oscillatoriales]MBD2180935.1 response regulator [Aerosakkonema funiforme FACHB-1375]MBD3562329.1 response regulator [Planktothrix sp. FACHB-1355]
MSVASDENLNPEILVVDDTPVNLRLLVNILRKNGYKVRPVNNGHLALQVAKSILPDLILLDILMPSLDGYQVCEKLKADPETSGIPVIFISALNEGLDKAKAFQVGGADYISKPFQVEEILARVANQISQRSLQNKLQQQAEILHQQNLQLQSEINSRQLLEEKLLASEHKMRAVFEAMTDIVMTINIQEGQLGNIDILPTNSITFYQDDTDLVSYIIEEIFHAENHPSWLSIIEQTLETRQTINFDYSLNIYEKGVWLAVMISPLNDDTVILVARDISDRKLAEEALRIAQERYHSIVENAIDGIYQTTPEGRYLSANPALARIYGYSSPLELMQSIQNISRQIYVDPKRRQEFIVAMEAHNAVSGFESMVYRKEGKIIWISETARAVRNSSGKLQYYEGIVSDITERKQVQEALKFQQAQTEQLLLSILPQPIAHRLKAGENPIADRFEEVSVLFADMVGFTKLSTEKNPTELVELLNEIFSEFDLLAKKHGLEKIKTIGDAYMVVGGVPIPREDSASAIALMALDMQAAIARFNANRTDKFQLRIGINIGPVVAGVIGMSKFIYDLWGDTVNIASRMESNGLPGMIQVTAAIYERLKDEFEFEERGTIPIKGKGEMIVYILTGKRFVKHIVN